LLPEPGSSRSGVDDAPCADDEEDTDVGAPIEQPADLEVRGGGAQGSALIARNAEGNYEEDEAVQAAALLPIAYDMRTMQEIPYPHPLIPLPRPWQ
jgi:hypothetical protein